MIFNYKTKIFHAEENLFQEFLVQNTEFADLNTFLTSHLTRCLTDR